MTSRDAAARSFTPVCAVGASAGGVGALQAFFSRVDPDLGIAYVVVIHLSPDHPSQLSEILDGCTDMPVAQVVDAARLAPDRVYVIAPDRQLVIAGDDVTAHPFAEPQNRHASIDLFFRSVAAARGDGVAVVLSGASADGSLGVRAIKEAGGIVMVQEPAEAEYPMMPRSAIATGAADLVAPIADLAARLREVVRIRHVAAAIGVDDVKAEMRRIMSLLHARTGHDFSHYKRATVTRRVMRRMQVTRCDSLGAYAAFLRETPEEAQELFGDLLISVTQFFRDPAAFERLAQTALAEIFDALRPDGAVRAWVVGCATGEEAYGLAMLMLEECARRKIAPQIQIFASDLDEGALATAREGRYPRSIEADVSEARLARFFTEEGPHLRIRKEVRDLVLFAAHSALKDPPFLRLDLISCRNLLIYLDRDLQTQLCTVFHYGLRPGGWLFLGSAETADAAPDLFAVVDRDARLYRARPTTTGQLPMLSQMPTSNRPFAAGRDRADRRADGGVGEAHLAAVERHAPPSALVDEQRRVLHLSAGAGRFLRPPGGPFSADLPALLRPELRVELELALARAFERGEPSLSPPIDVDVEAERRRVSLHVAPVAAPARAGLLALVFFMDAGPAPPLDAEADAAAPGDAAETEPETADDLRRLRADLRAAQERLAASRGEHDLATQELRAANEELQSINEEYRSTSEELETSKEELQSMNEELQTVNSELKTKLDAISSAHSDLQNLIAATEVGTLFLDPKLRIKMFTPTVGKLFNITEADVGRAIAHFTHNLDYDRLEADASRVVRDLAPLEREIPSRQGRWLLLRMRPYRTIDDRIDGVVVTFIDITDRREAATRLRETRDLLTMAMAASRLGWGAWNYQTGEAEWDARAAEIMGLSQDEAARQWREVVHPEDRARFEAHIRDCIRDRKPYDLEFRIQRPDGSVRHAHGVGVFEFREDGTALRGAGLLRDVTERKNREESQRLLVAELNHRVKNMLAVVQSVARQTQRTTHGAAAFVEAFERRVEALARAHDLLTRRSWQGATLRDLAEEARASFLADGETRIGVAGPHVALSPAAVISFAMALHELGTNAIKHGALSTPEGHIDITWRVQRDGPAPMLHLDWVERGGPKVTAPSRSGFGTRMLERGIAGELGGVVRLVHAEEGLCCHMAFPLDGKLWVG